jgi:type IV secretory pathway VirB10-like protein
MKLKSLTCFVLFVAACQFSTSAFAQYVWLDDHGVKQYSDAAPPANVPQNRILKQPHPTAPNYSSATKEDEKPADASADNTPKGPQTQAEKETEYKKRHEEQLAKQKKADEDAKKAQEKADNCARAKSYYEGLQSGIRIQSTDANGERTYLSDEDRAKEAARAQDIMNSCNK